MRPSSRLIDAVMSRRDIVLPHRQRIGVGEPVAIGFGYAVVGASIAITESRLLAPDRAASAWAVRHRSILMFLRHPWLPAMVPLSGLAVARLHDARASYGIVALAGGTSVLSVTMLSRRLSPVQPVDRLAAMLVGCGSGVILRAACQFGVSVVPYPLPGDALRLALGGVVVAAATPWILADLGVYVGDIPGLRTIFLSRHSPLDPGFDAVHLGHHHGMDGALLTLTALLASRQLFALPAGPPREMLSLATSGLLIYGLSRWGEDLWNEQVVKRGWTRRKLPIVVRQGRPEGRRVWLGLCAIAVTGHAIWSRDRKRSVWATPVTDPG